MRKLLLISLLAFVGCSSKATREAVYRSVSWKELACFKYEPSVDPKGKLSPKKIELPNQIACLQGQRLHLQGYMMPVDVEGRQVRSFVLVRDQQLCCYGKMPAMNEWVFVSLDSSGVEMNMDRPVDVKGTFEVGEDIEEGVVVSLYRMKCDSVTLTEGKPKGWIAN
jgi:hypothetical protein